MKNILAIALAIGLLFTSCNNPNKAKAENALDKLETWFNSLEIEDDNISPSTLEKLKLDYLEVKQDVNSLQNNLSEESKQEYQQLQKEFDDIQKKYKAAIDNTQVEANEKMIAVEAWMDSYIGTSENDLDIVEEEWNSFKTDFMEHWDELSTETQEKWNTLENRVNQWIEYELKLNLK